MNERQLNALKGVKTWNMVLLVFGAIGLVISLIGIPEILNPTRENYVLLEELGMGGLAAYEMMNTPFYKGYSLVSILISAVLLVFYIKAHSTIKKEKLPSDFPYFLTIGIQLISLIIAFFTARQTFVITLIVTIIYCILPILVLSNLSKVESNK
jgi:hypothetical protein